MSTCFHLFAHVSGNTIGTGPGVIQVDNFAHSQFSGNMGGGGGGGGGGRGGGRGGDGMGRNRGNQENQGKFAFSIVCVCVTMEQIMART